MYVISLHGLRKERLCNFAIFLRILRVASCFTALIIIIMGNLKIPCVLD